MSWHRLWMKLAKDQPVYFQIFAEVSKDQDMWREAQRGKSWLGYFKPVFKQAVEAMRSDDWDECMEMVAYAWGLARRQFIVRDDEKKGSQGARWLAKLEPIQRWLAEKKGELDIAECVRAWEEVLGKAAAAPPDDPWNERNGLYLRICGHRDAGGKSRLGWNTYAREIHETEFMDFDTLEEIVDALEEECRNALKLRSKDGTGEAIVLFATALAYADSAARIGRDEALGIEREVCWQECRKLRWKLFKVAKKLAQKIS